MSEVRAFRIPSLVKKYLMAGTGLVMVLFVLGHMLGNLQVFSGSPEAINHYAHFLKSLGELLWVVRIFLLACIIVHVWMAILLAGENRAARPQNYARDVTVQASYASRTMLWSGLIILAFILFHLAQFTLLVVEPKYSHLIYILDGHEVADVYATMILGFANPAVSGFYILAVWLLCVHLSHGVSSMFQSVGLRNEKWRQKLNQAAQAYGLIIFVGFASIPTAVLFSEYSDTQLLPTREIVGQFKAKNWDPAFPTPIGINYFLILPEEQSASAPRSSR